MPSDKDIVVEARELLETHAVVAMCTGRPYNRIRPLMTELCDEVEALRQANTEIVDECGHWRAEAEHYAERPLEDFTK